MKRMGAVESDNVKSARKAKDKLQSSVKEGPKLVSKLCKDRNKTMRKASMRESRDSDRFLINTQVQCTAVPRVWHFSAFHSYSYATGHFHGT